MNSKYKKILAIAFVAVTLSGAVLPAFADDSVSFVGIRKNRTSKILDDFKEKQDILLFDNTPFMLAEESGLFDSQARVQSLENVAKRLDNVKTQYQQRKIDLQTEKVTLRNLLKRLDASIEDSMGMIKDTEIEIVKWNRDIADLEAKATVLKAKIEANRKTILEYLTYVYSKGDLVYSDGQDVDLLKSVILNDGDFSEILTDIHYKSLLESAGQNFIEIRRDLLKQYYLDTESLKAQKIENLRRKTAIRERRKQLEDQRAYKEQLLRITQGQEALFNRYIMEKTARQKEIENHIDDIQANAETLFENFASRYGCSPSGTGAVATPADSLLVLPEETESLSGALTQSGMAASSGSSAIGTLSSKKCADVRQFYEAEKSLRGSAFLDDSGKTNPFIWPVEPDYISAYFHDPAYYASVGSDHEAIDIPTEQGTDIVAPADGYVYFVNPPVEGGYGYVALKHSNGFLTVYGHVSAVMAERFQFVAAGQVFAKSGGTPGTPGAGLMTSGAHLHFEVHHNRETLDPLRFVDTTHLRYETLDSKYSYKYLQDLKARYGRRANLSSYETFHIVGNSESERQKYLLDNYAVGDFKNWDTWTEEGVEGKIDPSFLMCVGLAETGLGKNLKTPYNIGNVWNTDSGETAEFPTARDGIYSIVKTFNNKYLGSYQSISELSRWGNKDRPIYASSPKNWHTNIVRCLSALKGRFVEDDYKFRLSPEEADEAAVQAIVGTGSSVSVR